MKYLNSLGRCFESWGFPVVVPVGFTIGPLFVVEGTFEGPPLIYKLKINIINLLN
jgi:hypothetical protein